jgi:hypothetical protein
METEAKKGGDCGSTMREMSKATTALLKSCTNVPYLQDVLKH